MQCLRKKHNKLTLQEAQDSFLLRKSNTLPFGNLQMSVRSIVPSPCDFETLDLASGTSRLFKLPIVPLLGAGSISNRARYAIKYYQRIFIYDSYILFKLTLKHIINYVSFASYIMTSAIYYN